jgi:hypothetical protein
MIERIFHFALMGWGNGVARTSAFPNGVGERGMRVLLVAVVSVFALGGIGKAQTPEAFQARMNAWRDLGHITRGDLAFFFDRIAFKDGNWDFKLSPNVRGMLWRIRNDNDYSDVTGACGSGQVLTLASSSTFELKRKDFDLVFLPKWPGAFNVRFVIKPEPEISKDFEGREITILKGRSDGHYTLVFAED